MQQCDIARPFCTASRRQHYNILLDASYEPAWNRLFPTPLNLTPSPSTRPGCNCNASAMCLCFDLYDTDHNGQISLPEADFMIEDIFGPGWASKDEAREVHAWVHERDDAVLGQPQLDVDAWATFVAANLQIQAPAIHTRLILQTKVFILYIPRYILYIYRIRTAVLLWGQSTWNVNDLCPKTGLRF